MKKSLSSLEPVIALQCLCAEPAAAFGARLLARAEGPAIPFRTFVAVARELIDDAPDATATWLAAMIALQMYPHAEAAEEQAPPSAN